MNEDEFLAHLRQRVPGGSATLVGIGDDAALLPVSEGHVLVTVDAFVEGVHFPEWMEPGDLARKAVTASLSDIQAVGGRGTACFVSLGLSKKDRDKLPAYADAVLRSLQIYGLSLSGGDTVSSPKRFLSLAITGRLPAGLPPVLRSGALPGQSIYLSGPIGGAAAGLRLVLEGWSRRGGDWVKGEKEEIPSDGERNALDVYLNPRISYPLGWDLHGRGWMASAIDVSDGLALDLERLCRASRVGAEVRFEKIPVHEGARGLSAGEILSSGEEFQLLWTGKKGQPYPCIGEITRKKDVVFYQGSEILSIPVKGWDHFSE